MARWQRARVAPDRAFFYKVGSYGINGDVLISARPYDAYYGLLAACRMNDYKKQLPVSVNGSLAAVAGRNDRGECALLVSAFRSDDKVMDVDLGCVPEYCIVELLDNRNKLTPIRPELDGSRLSIRFSGSSAVAFIRFKPGKEERK